MSQCAILLDLSTYLCEDNSEHEIFKNFTLLLLSPPHQLRKSKGGLDTIYNLFIHGRKILVAESKSVQPIHMENFCEMDEVYFHQKGFRYILLV